MRWIIIGCDGCTTNAVHWKQWQPHINIVYALPNEWCAWIAMLSTLESMAVEIVEVWIHCCNFCILGALVLGSLVLSHLFRLGFLQLTWVGQCLGVLYWSWGNWGCNFFARMAVAFRLLFYGVPSCSFFRVECILRNMPTNVYSNFHASWTWQSTAKFALGRHYWRN